MKWKVRLVTKRRRKQALRVKANSIEDLVEKLTRHAGKIEDLVVENAVGDPNYWKSLILSRLFEKTHAEDINPILS